MMLVIYYQNWKVIKGILSMSNIEILEKIRKSVTSFTSLEPEQIKLESNMSGDLGLDSSDRLELVLDMEEQYNVKIPDEEYSWCKTVQDLCELIDTIKKGLDK